MRYETYKLISDKLIEWFGEYHIYAEAFVFYAVPVSFFCMLLFGFIYILDSENNIKNN